MSDISNINQGADDKHSPFGTNVVIFSLFAILLMVFANGHVAKQQRANVVNSTCLVCLQKTSESKEMSCIIPAKELSMSVGISASICSVCRETMEVGEGNHLRNALAFLLNRKKIPEIQALEMLLLLKKYQAGSPDVEIMEFSCPLPDIENNKSSK